MAVMKMPSVPHLENPAQQDEILKTFNL